MGGTDSCLGLQATRIHDIIEQLHQFITVALCPVQKFPVLLRWKALIKLDEQFEVPLHGSEWCPQFVGGCHQKLVFESVNFLTPLLPFLQEELVLIGRKQIASCDQ